jgi:hypothetical protein
VGKIAVIKLAIPLQKQSCPTNKKQIMQTLPHYLPVLNKKSRPIH